MSESQRYYGLDFFRSLMMVLGLVLHSAQYYTLTDFNPTKYKAAETSMLMDLLMVSINTFRMPAFFLLAGFFFSLMLARRGSSETFRNRSGRIMLPFLVYTPIICGALAALDILGANLMYGSGFALDPSLLKTDVTHLINTQHLWFVYYLIAYYLFAFAAMKYAGEGPFATAFDWLSNLFARLCGGWAGLLFIGSAIGLIGLGLETGRVRTDTGFLPNIRPVIFFGVFFYLGIFMHRGGTMHLRFEAIWGRLLILATILMFVGIGLWQMGPEKVGLNDFTHKLILALTNGQSSWFFSLGFWGLALAAFKSYKPWVRYFSDCSYWVFLVHLPILAAVAALIHYWPGAAELKFLIVLMGGLVVCVGSYALFVRNSWIGEALSGRRFADAWPMVEPESNTQHIKKPAE